MARSHLQYLGYRDRVYRVHASRQQFRTDRETGKRTFRAECTLIAEDIAEISPWIMQGGPAEVFVRRNHFNGKGQETGYLKYCYHEARTTKYWEDFDKELGVPLLHFHFKAEAVTSIDNSAEQKLNNLLDNL